MRRALLAIVLALVSTSAFAQNQQTFPRVRVSFDGTADLSSLDVGGWTRLRATAFVPPVSAPGEARIYFDGTSIWISENGGAWRIIGGGNGTVVSVGLSLPSIFTVSGSPVTSTGTLTGALATQTANRFFAGPAAGGAAAPTFRAFDVADIPNGIITFAKWSQNGCATGMIPKWNGSAWACAGDDTSPGGASWLTAGNTLGATGAKIGSLDSFDWSFIRNNVVIGNVTSNGIDTTGYFESNASGTNVVGFRAATTNVGAQLGFMRLVNRTSTLPVVGGTESVIIMDNGALKMNVAGAGWVPLGGSVKTLSRFRPQEAEQPSTNFATFDTRNNHPVLDFDAATDEEVNFTDVMPEDYDGGNLTVQIAWAATSATSGNVIWCAQFELIDTSNDIDTDSFGTAICSTQTTQGVSGQVRTVSISFTNTQADSIVAGAPYRLKIYRDANAAGDTMAGDAELRTVHVRKQ